MNASKTACGCPPSSVVIKIVPHAEPLTVCNALVSVQVQMYQLIPESGQLDNATTPPTVGKVSVINVLAC